MVVSTYAGGLDYDELDMAAADAWQFSRLVVAALYADSPQVHWASGVLGHVDVPVPKLTRPGVLAPLAGAGA